MKVLFLLMTLGLGAAFAKKAQLEPEAPLTPRQILEKAYEPGVRIIQPTTVKGCAPNDVVISAKDGVNQKMQEIHLEERLPESSPKGTVFLVPPTGGINALDQDYAEKFCEEQTLRVVIIKNWGEEPVGLDATAHDRELIRGHVAMRHVLDYINEERVAYFGTSLGAIAGPFLWAMDDRIVGGSLIVGGTNLSRVIAVSTERGLTRLRDERMKRFGFQNLREYEQYIEDSVIFNPGDFAESYRHKPVLFVRASKDTTVPTQDQDALIETFHQPEVLSVDADHITGILLTRAFYKKQLMEFPLQILKQ